MRISNKLLWLPVIAVGVIISNILIGSVNAAMNSTSISYTTSDPIKVGSIVAQNTTDPNSVVPADTTNADKVVGITVEADQSLIAINPSDARVQVATSGEVSALVSTLGGDIAAGDRISVSVIRGVGAKNTDGIGIVGIARSAFSASSDGATTQSLTDNEGVSRKVSVGYIEMTIPSGVENVKATAENAELNSLQRLVKALTGKTVSTARVVIAVLIALVTILVLSVFVYASIYGSIISIGRNPLAHYSILQALLYVTVLAVLLVAVAAAVIYFLLR